MLEKEQEVQRSRDGTIVLLYQEAVWKERTITDCTGLISALNTLNALHSILTQKEYRQAVGPTDWKLTKKPCWGCMWNCTPHII